MFIINANGPLIDLMTSLFNLIIPIYLMLTIDYPDIYYSIIIEPIMVPSFMHARVECLLCILLSRVWFSKTFVFLHFLLQQRNVFFTFFITLIVDMPRGFSRRFIRHGLLLCTSAIGTGFLGQYLFEVD